MDEEEEANDGTSQSERSLNNMLPTQMNLLDPLVIQKLQELKDLTATNPKFPFLPHKYNGHLLQTFFKQTY